MGNSKICLYGKVQLVLSYCKDCKYEVFIIDGKYSCCGKEFTEIVTEYKQVAYCTDSRFVSKSTKRKILESQGDCCIYCEEPFNSIKYRKDKEIVLTVEFDHKIPYTMIQDSSKDNIVAACQVCNGIKSDTLYQNLNSARIDLFEKRKQKGYNF